MDSPLRSPGPKYVYLDVFKLWTSISQYSRFEEYYNLELKCIANTVLKFLLLLLIEIPSPNGGLR